MAVGEFEADAGEGTAKLTIAYITDFDPLWWDHGSGVKTNCSFWRPKVPAGYFALGHFCWASHDNPTDKDIVLAVKGVPGSDALKHPTGYGIIWNTIGSGVKRKCSVWMPFPPEGYVALGSVVSASESVPPAITEVMCVKNELVERGLVSKLIWSDEGSGAASSPG